MVLTSSFAEGARFLLYLPRLLVTGPEQLRTDRMATLDGSVLFSDVSGFTALSEELAKEGKVGSERITDIINGAFTELLTVARLEGGELISFGGDALLLLFTGEEHERRAATAAHEMREALLDFAEAEAPVPLSVSQGIASGEVMAVIAGTNFKQLVVVGDVVDEMLDLESAAESGEVMVSTKIAHQLGLGGVSNDKPGVLLDEAPEPADFEPSEEQPDDDVDLAAFVPRELRDELTVSGAQGEHRPAVVGFVRAAGIGRLLAAGGPEAVRESLDRLVDAADDATTAHQVTFLSTDVSRDGVKLIITAGVPRATPDPEERILLALRQILTSDTLLDLHVGTAVGDVFSGDLGATFRRGYTVMGDTVNLAARLAGKADAGQLLSTARVLDRSRTAFETRELEPVALKGKSAPLTPIEVGNAIDGEQRSDEASLPLIGRDEELASVASALKRVSDQGELVEVFGDIGMGKTRLLAEVASLDDEAAVMRFECEEYQAASPYWAAGLLLRRLAGLEGIESATDSGSFLQTLVEREASHLLPWLPLLAVPTGAHVEPTPEVDAIGEEFRSAKLGEIVGDLMSQLLLSRTLIAFDNAQWMDPASAELLQAVLSNREPRPWLWLFSHRTGLDAMSGSGRDLSIEIGPLDSDASMRLLIEAGFEGSPMRIEEVIDRSGGNPLFLIELAAAPPDVEIPDSLDRLLASRIDALGPRERRLLREASVIGEKFELDLLAESLGAGTPGVDDPAVWDRLGEFIQVGSTGRVRFVQPLIREVAYEGLPFRRRKELHGIVGETIERRARHRANRQASILSLHFMEAGHYEKAWSYARMGGDRAAERFAHREAVTLYERALRAAEHEGEFSAEERAQVAERLGDSADLAADYEKARWAYDLAIEFDEGPRRSDLIRKKALLQEKAGEYAEAIELLEKAIEEGDTPPQTLARIHVAMAGVRYRQGNYESSIGLCREALKVIGESDQGVVAHAKYLLALNQTHTGDPERIDNARAALEIYEEVGDWVGAGKVLNNLGINAYYDGRWDESIDLYLRGREASSKAGDVHVAAMLDNNVAEIYSDQGDLDQAELLFERAMSTWQPARFEAGIGLVTSNRGRIEVRRGRAEAGRELLSSALETFERIGAEGFATETKLRLAEAQLHLDPEEALATLDRLIADLGEDGSARTLAAFIHRLRGHGLALSGRREEAIAALQEARDSALAENAPYEAALATTALGRLGDPRAATEAHNVLSDLSATDAVIPPLSA